MHKTAVVFAMALAFITSSSRASDAALQNNKETVRRFFDVAWTKGDFTGMEDYLGPQLLLHFRGEQYVVDLAGTQALISSWRSAFPDFRFVVHDLIGERDRVAIRLTYAGTHTGADWFGIAPTGRSMNVTEMMFFRFEGGKIVEAWEDYDEYGMREQLRALPAGPASEARVE